MAPTFEQGYRAAREAVGIRPVTDLAIFEIRGTDAASALDRVVAGPVERLAENRLIWTAMLDDDGGVVADVQLYKDFDDYLITCGADVRRSVGDALNGEHGAHVEVEDVSQQYSVVVVEGPDALGIPAQVIGPEVEGMSPLTFTRCPIAGADGMLSRVGFTGEFSYHLFVTVDGAATLVERLRAAVPHPVAVESEVLDLLRLEVRSFNRARDLPRGETALQAGLHWMIDFRKPDFVGREAVMEEKATGLVQRLVCFVVDGDARIAPDTALRAGDEVVGYVANAGWSPRAGRTIGLAYVDDACGWVGVGLESDNAAITLVSAPFFVTESARRAAGW